MRWATLLLMGCPADPPTPDLSECEAPSWDDFAQGYVSTWCTPCHTETLTGADRHGAPPGVDFDRWSQVYDWRGPIALRATGPEADMPPVGGVDPADVERFGAWLACGAEGEDPPAGPCDAVIRGDAATVATQADADALCAVANRVPSLTVTGPATIACLCSVEGPLVVSGEAGLPLLRDAGPITVSGGSLAAPELAWAASLTVSGGTTALDLPGLQAVGGDVRLVDLTALRDVAFDGLLTVGGGWVVARSPTVETVDLPRLRSVGGDFVQEDLSELRELSGTRAVERVGGSLVLHRMPRWSVLDDWGFLLLAEVGGDLVVEDNLSLVAIHGFTTLPSVPGAVRIERNAALVRVDGFDLLTHVGGELRITGNPRQQHVLGFVNLERIEGVMVLEDLPQLRSTAGFGALLDVGGLRTARGGADVLDGFGALHTVRGDLVLSAWPRLATIGGFGSLGAVEGDLVVVDNPALDDVRGWDPITTVGGSVEVRDNPVLPTPLVDGWVGGMDVGGTVTVEGNGPG